MRVHMTAVLLLLLPLVAAAPEEPGRWTTWSDDGSDATVPVAGADIDKVLVGTSGTALHLALRTFPSPGTLPASSEVEFAVEQEGRASVRFTWEDAPALWIDGKETQTGWQTTEASDATDWHVEIHWGTLRVASDSTFSLRGLEAAATRASMTDTATGPDLAFVSTGTGTMELAALLEAGVTIEGPDFAGGTSITTDGLGEPLVAYYVYDEERGDPRGIYLARIDATQKRFLPERISDVSITRDNGRDGQMRTQVVHDGEQPFVLFTDDPAVDNDEDGPGHPGTPDSVYVLARADAAWSREDPTPGGVSGVGPEDVAGLAARDGRLVAAVPVGDDVWVTQRSAAGAWSVLARIEGATNAKLALDSQGDVHVAYVVYGEQDDRSGTLYYASGADGYAATHIGDNIDAGWEGPETDGSYAIAVGPDDEVALVWNDGRSRDRDKEQRVAILKDGTWSDGYAPLRAVHGNPQYTMRLGFGQDGSLAASSGYGGTDTLAVLSQGTWTKVDLPRYDVWDMAVAPSGLVYFGYTQPHGGTTAAVTVYGAPGQAATETESMLWRPADAEVPGLGLAAVAAALLATAVRRR